MAKGKDKKLAKPGDAGAATTAKTPASTPLPRGLRKQMRRLERQLADAARKERKRVRKLERARSKRQVLQAAIVELRGEAFAGDAPSVKPAEPVSTRPRGSARPTTAPASRATRAATPARTPAAATARPTSGPRPVAGRARTVRKPTPPAAPKKPQV